jgi:hypothetical protein
MMKKLFFLCVTLFISLAAYSQDIIIKKSGEEVKVKILEIGVSEIKYKRFDFQDGPVYSINKGEVVLVRYENGVNEVITTAPATTPTTPTTTPTTPTVVTTPTPPPTPEKVDNTITNSAGSYRQNGRYISKTRVITILKATNDPEILKLLRRSSSKKVMGTSLALGLGLPLIIVGSITTLRGAINMGNTYNVDPDAKGTLTVGAVMAGTGVMLQFMNIGFQVKSNHLIEDAVALYNQKYANPESAK